MTELQKMTDLERALLHIKTRADAWALKEVEKALSQNCVGSTQKHVGNALDMRCDDAISREAVKELIKSGVSTDTYDDVEQVCKWIDALPSVTQKSKTGHCKECKYFEYDSVAKVDGIPLIVAHEICNKWGDGCKTKEDGYCFLFELRESEEQTE